MSRGGSERTGRPEPVAIVADSRRGQVAEGCSARDGQINSAASGPLVRHLHGGRLTDRSVALIVKAAAFRIGLDPADFGGHSLRAGFITSTADGGASEAAIMEQTGHRSTKGVRR